MITGSIIKAIRTVIDKTVPDADKRVELKKSLVQAVKEADRERMQSMARVQAVSSGIRWVDGLKHLVRPFVVLLVMGRLLQSWITGAAISHSEWQLVQIVVGFYFFSRGTEKVVNKVL